MPMEALRRGDEFAVYLDLPGVNPDDVDVTVENNVVTIRARRTPQREEGDEVIADERTYGEFTRQLFLGDNLDPNGLTADLANGVLTLRIPVSEASKPRRIALASSERDGTTEAVTRRAEPMTRRRAPPRPLGSRQAAAGTAGEPPRPGRPDRRSHHVPSNPPSSPTAHRPTVRRTGTYPSMTKSAKLHPARRRIATFDNYADAERAVERSPRTDSPCERVAIVGHDLRSVEQVTGRLTYASAAWRGALSGALPGALIGWIFGLLQPGSTR